MHLLWEADIVRIEFISGKGENQKKIQNDPRCDRRAQHSPPDPGAGIIRAGARCRSSTANEVGAWRKEREVTDHV